jgi:hypothetical protein
MTFILTPPIKEKLIEFRVKNLQVFKAFYDDAALVAQIKGKSYAIENPLVKPMRPTVNAFRGYLSPDAMEPIMNDYSEYEQGFEVTYTLKSYENAFVVDKMDLEVADPAFILVPKIKAAQDGVIKALEESAKQEVFDKAHTITGGTWVSSGAVDPAQIEDDVKNMVKQIKNSVIWQPEDFDKLTLYLPVELKIDFKEFDSGYRTTTVEDIIKKYVADIKYTPLLENEAVMMIKNDPYGLTRVEHVQENTKSPYEKIEETDEVVMYKFRVRADVKAIPDPKHPSGKTYRIIKLDNIIA